MFMELWICMLLYLRKYFTENEHGFICITKHKYVIRRYYLLCETLVEHPTNFVEASRKKAKLEELSNNISERRCELKMNEPVSERSERASGYFVGCISKEPSVELLVYLQYSI